MTVPAPHFDLVREMKDAYNHRLRLVESAKQRGIKPTARALRHTASGMAPGLFFRDVPGPDHQGGYREVV